MLRLPDVSLVTVETMAHELAGLALTDCLKVADFGEVFVYTDDPAKLKVNGAVYQQVENWPSKLECVRFCAFEISKPVHTSHILFVEWDAGIFDPEMWNPEFLNYDFVGAPWWWNDDFTVGNGGFSLRSKRLIDHLAEHRDKYPVVNSTSDDTLCRVYRTTLEKEGFRWAPPELALDFAFETVRRSTESRHFGYHALRNWPAVLDSDALAERLMLAGSNEYIRRSGMLGQLGFGPPYYITGTGPDGKWELTREGMSDVAERENVA